jgi:hypothetical protein
MARCIYFDMPWTGRIPTCGAGYLTCPNDKSCEGYRVAKPPTNADRIRGITDEQLAKLIMDKFSESVPFCQNKPECFALLDAGVEIPKAQCMLCALEWLRQPVEGE